MTAAIKSPASAPSAAAFVGSIPACYDQHLGPLLFDFSSADLARRLGAALQQPSEVLEVACGTGLSTDYLRRTLPQGSKLVATDLNPAMLEYAAEHRAAPNVSFRQADALDLPFEDDTFDAVVCQFGIMFFPDKARGLSEMARVLKPGGKLLLNVWDSFEKNRVVRITHETIGSFFQDNPPRFLEVPFGDYDIEAGLRLMNDAGLSHVRADVVREKVARSAASAARGFVEGTPGVLDIRSRGQVDTEEIVRAVTDAIEQAYGDVRPEFDLQEIVFSGTKIAAT